MKPTNPAHVEALNEFRQRRLNPGDATDLSHFKAFLLELEEWAPGITWYELIQGPEAEFDAYLADAVRDGRLSDRVPMAVRRARDPSLVPRRRINPDVIHPVHVEALNEFTQRSFYNDSSLFKAFLADLEEQAPGTFWHDLAKGPEAELDNYLADAVRTGRLDRNVRAAVKRARNPDLTPRNTVAAPLTNPANVEALTEFRQRSRPSRLVGDPVHLKALLIDLEEQAPNISWYELAQGPEQEFDEYLADAVRDGRLDKRVPAAIRRARDPDLAARMSKRPKPTNPVNLEALNEVTKRLSKGEASLFHAFLLDLEEQAPGITWYDLVHGPEEALNEYLTDALRDGRASPLAPRDGLRCWWRATKVKLGPRMFTFFMALTAHDPRLPGLSRAGLTQLRGKLEEDVLAEMRRLIQGQAPSPPRCRPRRLSAHELPAHEQPLAGRFGLVAAEAPAEQRPTLRNGKVLGLYLGALFDTDEEAQAYAQQHPGSVNYEIDAPRRSGQVRAMSALGAANSAAFANTALLPGPGKPAYDKHRLNALFVPFDVSMIDNKGRPRCETAIALVALDNLYSAANPHRMVLADYGDDYLVNFEIAAPRASASPDRTDVDIKMEGQ